MKAAIAGSIRVATVALLVLAGGVTFAAAQCLTAPSYDPDFASNQGCLSLTPPNAGSPSFGPPPLAVPPSTATALRLTAPVGSLATSAWYKTPQPVANGFSTTFSFQIGGSTSTSTPKDADGIAFVIQNSAVNALGPGGCGIGFGGSSSGCAGGSGIPKSVAIEFNTFNNGDPVDPNTSNDVAIQSCGAAANSVDYGSTCGLAHNNLASSLADGNAHTAIITYTPSTLSNCGNNHDQTCSTLDVVLDTVDLFPGGVLFDITTIGLTNSSAYVGFTAGTGGSNDEQDILSWTFSPQNQTQTGTVNPGQTDPTTFPIDGGFTGDNPTTGYDFTARETPQSSQTVQMQVTAIPMSQQACNTLVQKNTNFKTANCFVYQNGGSLGNDEAVMFEVTCPGGSCGATGNPFYADLGTHFAFMCAKNSPLECGLPQDGTPTSFGFPNLTSVDGLPAIGFLKGEGPDALHPCTPNSDGATPLFQSNQIDTFILGDTSGSVKGASGGTTSCWVLTYLTQNETPGITITQPANGASYTQGQNAAANYACSALYTAADSSVGPYLTVASCNGFDSQVPASLGTAVANGIQFDTSTLGPHYFTVQVQDSAENTNTKTVTYTVGLPPSISAASSATFTVGSLGSVPISAAGSPVPALSESGALPPGVTFVDNHNGTATIAGTPTVSGVYPITITAQNGVGSKATQAFTLTVVTSAPASGTKCNGVYTGTFKGNVTVTAGQTCTFISGGITGNVTQTSGSLNLRNALVGGNIQIIGGTFSIGPPVVIKGNLLILDTTKSSVPSQVCGASLAGGLQVVGSSTPVVVGSGTPACPGNTISGNLLVSLNLASTSVSNNTVGGNLQDLGNFQPTQVSSNHIKGILSCTTNSSITGSGNTATKKTGQCAAF